MTTFVDESYTEMVTKLKPATKTVKKVRFVPKTVNIEELQFD